MSQWLKEYALLSQTTSVWMLAPYDSSSSRADIPFWPQLTPAPCTHTTHAHITKKKKNCWAI